MRIALGRWKRLLVGSRPTRLLVISAALLIGVILVASIAVISKDRALEIQDAERELLTLNLSLAEQASRAIQGVDLVLSAVSNDLKVDGVDSAEDLIRLESGPEVFKKLRARAMDVPQLDAVTLIGADGTLINFSRYYPIPPVNVSDRDYFKVLSAAATDHPFISAPVENRGSGTFTLYVARRIDNGSGKFIGLVLGAVKLGYFEEFYERLALGPGSAISLWRRDGTMLARYPSIGGIGKTFALKSFTETLQNANSGVYRVTHSIDGKDRVVATRALRDYPMVVNVTRDMDQVLAGWRDTALAVSWAGLLCSAALALVARMLVRQFGAFESLGLALREKAEAVIARERVENELFQSQKLEAVGKLSTGIAHDFNNLLTAIIGNLSFLHREARDPVTQRRVLAMEKAVDRAATLTGQLLAFSRKQHLFPEELDLNILISSMDEMLRSSLGGTIILKLELREGLWATRVDRAQIELVLLNLAINARDAMPSGGVLTISAGNISAGTLVQPSDPPEGDYVFVSVSDTGTGMTEEVLARAFDPFFTTKPVGQGTGLGLSQAYGTVHQSGGDIRIQTKPGLGTSVTIYLPGVRDPAGQRAADAPAATIAPAGIKEDAYKLHALVVDDDEPVRDVIVEMLTASGCLASQAENGDRALAILANKPDIGLIVMDFAMPEMNGAEVARRVRETRPDLPIVFVTGYAELEKLAGERSVLQKPFRQSDLQAKIHQALLIGQDVHQA